MKLVDPPSPESIQTFLDNCPDRCYPADNITILWSKSGVGFGEMRFELDKETNQLHCNNEGMSKAFLKEMLSKMVDACIMEMPNKKDK